MSVAVVDKNHRAESATLTDDGKAFVKETVKEHDVIFEAREACSLGIELRESHGRGGTQASADRALRFASGSSSAEDFEAASAHVARITEDDQGGDESSGYWGNPTNPSARWVAFLLAGGGHIVLMQEGLPNAGCPVSPYSKPKPKPIKEEGPRVYRHPEAALVIARAEARDGVAHMLVEGSGLAVGDKLLLADEDGGWGIVNVVDVDEPQEKLIQVSQRALMEADSHTLARLREVRGISAVRVVLEQAFQEPRKVEAREGQGYDRSVGEHAHPVNWKEGKVGPGTPHAHLWRLEDGTMVGAAGGQHVHGIGEGERTENDGEHVHVVTLPGGETVTTEMGGAHDHVKLVTSTGKDGPHGHSLKVGEMILQSLSPAELAKLPGVFED